MREDWIRLALDAVPVDGVMAQLQRLVEYDRYQASAGIQAAADLVAQAARDAGLREVVVHDFPADGAHCFWSFLSPRGWTPRQARLRIGAGIDALEWDHARQPFLLATYSAPTSEQGLRTHAVRIGSADDLAPGNAARDAVAGAIALVEAEAYADPDLLPALRARGAVGFVTDGPCCVDPGTGVAYSGRIELDQSADWFGFSLTHAQFAEAKARVAAGAQIEVLIEIDRDAAMPVVTGVLPADDVADVVSTSEVWITSHLCHPRPGANDNGSGIVGLIGVAQTLRLLAPHASKQWPMRKWPIRFVWAPEFVGTAAFYQARIQTAGETGAPCAVLNLDMIGEDQTRCGSPFVVERPPTTQTSLLTPVAERVVEAVFAATDEGGGRWRSSPFLGYSDHALFAGPQLGCPAVQFAHWPDRFNHSAADTLDKVSPLEMRRSIAAAALLLTLAADDYAALGTSLPELVERWCAREEDQALSALPTATEHAAWREACLRAMYARHTDLRLRARGESPSMHAAASADTYPGINASHQERILPRWQGPFKLRAMIGDTPEPLRGQVRAAVRRDKSTLAWLANIAVHLDGSRGRAEVLAAASHAMRRPWDPALADLLWQAWIDSGWAEPVRP
ncbi:MAG: DUF4910 domain-containing protein [Lysobacteraceae bacterium]|nr:MAG: DUF4910 domain-containing protein [Xanthomonadaceae bacterium]